MFVYNVNSRSYRLLRVGKIPTEADLAINERGRIIRSRLAEILNEIPPDRPPMVVVEMPPQAIYGGHIMAKRVIVVRAMSMFRVFFCVGMVVDYLQIAGIKHRCIEPNQWQPSPKKRNKVDTKTWSMRAARFFVAEILKLSLDKVPYLDDHNVCDAINIGREAIRLIAKKEWSI